MHKHYLVKFKDGKEKKINTLEEFHDFYKSVVASNEKRYIAHWCTVSENDEVVSLSEYSLINSLFLWDVEPKNDGYVIYQIIGDKKYYKGYRTHSPELSKALIMSKERAQEFLKVHTFYSGMLPCTIEKRNNS